jgi:hypothetical protein
MFHSLGEEKRNGYRQNGAINVIIVKSWPILIKTSLQYRFFLIGITNYNSNLRIESRKKNECNLETLQI